MRVLTLALALVLLAAIGMAGPPPALADCSDHSVTITTGIGATDRAIVASTIGTAVTDPEGWLDLPAAVAINTPTSITESAEYGMNLAQVAESANSAYVGVKSGASSEKLGATTYTWRIHAGADAGGI